MSKQLVVQWPRFGPYHLARLVAAAQLAPDQLGLMGLEIAGAEATYPWTSAGENGSFERKTLFPGRLYESLGRRALWQATRDYLDEVQPAAAAICGYADPAAQVLLAWCRLQGRPAVLMSESKADDVTQRRPWKEMPKGLLVRQFGAAFCGGHPHRAYLEQLGLRPEQIFLGYDAVDNAYFQREAAKARREPDRVRRLPGLASPRPFFLASARFIPRKNLDGLLRAYAAYRQQVAAEGAWRLVILGDGDERLRLERLIREQAIPEVCLPGFRQILDLPAYYGRAGAFIHPALQEQWGLVVNEAMAAGLPVLVSDRCGCASDLIDLDRTGLLFDPTDISGLAQLMVRVSSGGFNLPALGAAAQERISHWGPERFAAGLWAAVRYCLEDRR